MEGKEIVFNRKKTYICKIVGNKVKNVDFREDEYVSLQLGNGYNLLISLEPYSYTGPEALSILLNTHGAIVIN